MSKSQDSNILSYMTRNCKYRAEFSQKCRRKNLNRNEPFPIYKYVVLITVIDKIRNEEYNKIVNLRLVFANVDNCIDTVHKRAV
jgi:hypothetical protein